MEKGTKDISFQMIQNISSLAFQVLAGNLTHKRQSYYSLFQIVFEEVVRGDHTFDCYGDGCTILTDMVMDVQGMRHALSASPRGGSTVQRWTVQASEFPMKSQLPPFPTLANLALLYLSFFVSKTMWLFE